MKICRKCNISKSLDCFNRSSRHTDGLRYECKECQSEYRKNYHLKNRDIALNKSRENYKNNKEEILAYNRINQKQEKCRKRAREYVKNKLRTNPNFKLAKNLRNRVNIALLGGCKSKSTIKLLGCSIEDFKIYLELNFSKGMTWENYGLNGWHIDHVRPCASFDLTNPIAQAICFHYSNLQPMWAVDNQSKKDKWKGAKMETPNVQKARKIAFEAHEGQLYGRYAYCFHLVDVVRILLEYQYDDENLIIAGYCHDLIEDTSITKEYLSVTFNDKVGKLVHAVSGEGKNRVEKKKCMLDRLAEYPKAVPLKMADRLANIRNCASNNTRMLSMYSKEMADYKEIFENCDPAMYQEMMELCKGV